MKGQSQHKQLLKEFLDIMASWKLNKTQDFIANDHLTIRKLVTLAEKVEKCLSAV